MNTILNYCKNPFESNSLLQNRTIQTEITKHLKEINAIEQDPGSQRDIQGVIDSSMILQGRIKQVFDSRIEDHSLLGRIKKIVLKFLNFLRIVPTDRDLKKLLNTLKINTLALGYRHFKIDRIAKDAVDEGLVARLKIAVIDYKKACPELYEPSQYLITAHDERQVRKIARYDRLALAILEDPKVLADVLKMTIRNLDSVAVTLLFPKTMELLYRTHIATVAGAYHGVKLLKCLRDVRSVGLQFDYEGRYVDILREKTIKVTSSETVTLKEVFDDFEAQKYRQGQYTMFRSGVAKWAMDKSWKDYLNAESPLNWYESLPEGVADVITYEELKKDFENFDIAPGDWVVSFTTTRMSVDRDVNNSHGFLRMYIPQQEEGAYKVYSPGVFATVWPVKWWEYALFAGNTVEAGWCIPDPNHTFTQRAKAEYPRIIRKDDVQAQQRFQQALKDSFLDKKLIFQWGGDNCACKAERLVTEKQPELILTRIDEAKAPVGLMPWMIPYKASPEIIKSIALKILIFTMGGFRSLHGKYLLNTDAAHRGLFHYPGMLHERIRRGELPGIVYGGHNRTNEILAHA